MVFKLFLNSSIKKIFFLLLSSVLVCGGLYVFLFLKVNASLDRSSTLALQVSVEVEKEKEVKTFLETIRGASQKREAIQSYFLNEKDVVSFIEEIELLGENTNVLVDIKSVNVKQANKESALDLDIVVQGTFDSVYLFLTLFERMPYAFSYARVFIKERASLPDASGSWEGHITTTLLSFIEEK